MAQSQAPESMLQGLQAILGQLGQLMATPDADPMFLMDMQKAITGKIRQSTAQSVAGQAQQMGPGGQAGGGMGGLAPGVMLPPGAMGGEGPPGGDAGGLPPDVGAGGPPPGMPNPDELRRVLGGAGTP